MKKLIAITTSVLVFTFFPTVSAHADKKTVEGFMLGTGIAILGAAFYSAIHNDSTPQQYSQNRAQPNKYRNAGYRYGRKQRNHRKARHQVSRGYWEIERIWIDPVYEKKWNPGHYNRKGDWVTGRHEKFLISNGFLKKEKIWVWY